MRIIIKKKKMSFLKKLIKAKPGGSMLGNLARGALKTATGGVLGNGVIHNIQLAKQAGKEVNIGLPMQQFAQGMVNGALATPEGSKLAQQGAKMGLVYYLEEYKMWVLGIGVFIASFFTFKYFQKPLTPAQRRAKKNGKN